MASTISAFGTVGKKFLSKSDQVSTSSRHREFHEGGHQLEKLEFALAIAQTRGDQVLADTLRSEIEALGGNIEEPGT